MNGCDRCPETAEPGRRTTPTGSPSQPDEIRRQLLRIVHSASFAHALRLTRFLSFVVEAAMAGNAVRIKAYTIATGALGRGADFDPQTDSIVRVEAGRLRQALKRYYEGPGSDDALLIELPCGSYVPRFHWRSNTARKPAAAPGRAKTLPDSSAGAVGAAAIAEHNGQLAVLLAALEDLVSAQRLHIAAVNEAIAAARQTLDRSRDPPRPDAAEAARPG